MESMTGYAFYEKSCDQFTFSIELKSLNNKYLETYVNLPKILKRSENDIQKKLKDAFSRGKLEMSIDIYDWIDTRPISLNAALVKKYYIELSKLHHLLKIETPLSLDSILHLEGVTQRERTLISAKSQKEINKALLLVMKKTEAMRLAEGAVIKQDILQSVAEINAHAKSVAKLSKTIAQNKKEALLKRLESLLGKNYDESRVYAEVAVLADKLDINEELVRLNDHIIKFKKEAANSGQVGRTLDFLAQEMFREINTIASKSTSSEISHHVVEMKNHIDKIREHSRNII